MENKRLTDISYLRTVAIFAIVLYHSFCPYMDWKFVSSSYNPTYNSIFKVWFGARMPLFLFISGFLFSYLLFVKNKYQSFTGFVWNKTKRLLIPYLIFATLIMLSHDKLSWVYLKNGYWHWGFY
jgi:fucose 4-O-acetylase-like acetyltransferase